MEEINLNDERNDRRGGRGGRGGRQEEGIECAQQ